MTPRSARIGLVLALGLGACGPKPAPAVVLTRPDGSAVEAPGAPSNADEASAAALASGALARERGGDAAAARAARDELVKRFPGTAAAADIYEARAHEASAAGHPAEALTHYERLLFYRPNFARVTAAREAYGLVLLEVGRFDDAAKMLGALFDGTRVSAERRRIGEPLVRAQLGAGHAAAGIGTLVALAGLPGLPAAAVQGYQGRAVAVVAENLDVDGARTVRERAAQPGWGFLQPVVGLKLAKVYYHVGDYDASEKLLQQLVAVGADSPYTASARDFLAFLSRRFEVDPEAIGVVLPLSGRYKQYGERSLQAIQMQIKARPGLRLVVKDSQGEANVAAQAVENLVLDSHVIGIVGPMFSAEAMAAALKAEELSVPLLALSHRDGLPEIGAFVFRTALTVAAQARALAHVAFDSLGFTSFGLLYPRSRYGIDFTQAFWDEVDRRRGEVRGAESYDPEQTTFREPVRRLVGRWYLNARADWRDATDALKRQKLSPLRLRSELDRLDKTLPPIVDFDALVIPDSGRQIGLIAPALAFEDVVLTHDPRTLEKLKKARGGAVRPLTLVGASTWNSAQTLDSCGNDCEQSIFVDAFFPNSTDPKLRDFVAGFREVSGGGDPILSEAQAYDTAGWLRTVLQASRPRSRQALQDALGHSPPYAGITGKMAFDENGEAQRDLFVLTIKEHTIQQWEPPPDTPRG